ncbi:serine proteinase stubble isoform X2 [Chironomus tepperi]|uniref:serine proteinase stubble isoform X2 n=1 Tax=Chironomus tepperi TaxID=113505 RepID=UPI00391EFC69
MYANSRTRRKWNQVLLFLVSCLFVKYSISSPILSSQFSQFQSARNLRNLPCVVRRSGMKGVCMFAIDCIKSNGTHLGTCIDKFYFGSCCQIKDVDAIYSIDLDDNRIDSSFPSPSSQQSLNNKNTRPVSTTSHPPSTAHFSSTNYKTSSKPAINYNNKTFELIPTTTLSSSTTLSKRPITTKKTTTEKYAVNVGGFSTTLGNIIERNVTNKINLNDETAQSTTESIKLTTFQTIQDSIKNVTKSTTMKVTSKTKPPIVTKRPVLNRTSDAPTTSVRPTRRPTGSSSSKPSKNSTTVIKLPPTTTAGTRKPVPTTVAVNRRTTLTSRRNSTTTRKPPPVTSSKPLDEQLLTTISYVETTKAPRPRPKPTSSVVKVEPTTLYDEDAFTTTYSVVSAGDDKKETTSKPVSSTTTTSTSTVKSTTVTRRPVTKPTSSFSTSHSTSKIPITDSETSMTGSSSSIITTHAATAASTMKIEVTQKPLNMTTDRIVEEIHQTTPSSTLMQQSSTLSNTGLITWTVGNEVTDNATKDDAWILLTSVTPNDSNSPSIIDTMTTERKVIESTTQSLINDNLTQSITDPNELIKFEETTIEIGSEENLIHISQEDNSSETSSIEVGVSEEEEDDEESEEETTLETKPIDTDSDEDITTVQDEPITTTTTRSASTTLSSSTSSATISQLSPNETQPVSVPDETTVNPELLNTTYDTTTLSSTETDSDESSRVNETTTTTPFTTTAMNLEGIDYKQICGRRMFPEARIVGGAKASFGRWPWQISLRQWRTSTYLHKCGSALLNENWAISAAHCVENVPPSDLLLRLGEYDLSIEEEPYGYQERRVQIVASHPQFDPRTFEYDLALLRFYEPVVFQPNIIPVCVPENDEDFIGRTAFVTGWGRLYEDGPLPSVLQEVSVPIIKNEICEAMYRSAGYIEHIPHIFICAGWQKGGRDSCEGDSGGPMVIQRTDKRFQLAGIISWGIGCAEPNQPGVYTRISEFRDWINQILMF